MNQLTPVLIIGIICWAIYKIIELLVQKKERLSIIDKLPLLNNGSAEGGLNLPSLNYGKKDTDSWSLRAALMMTGVGLGCIIAFFVEINIVDMAQYTDYAWRTRSAIEFPLYFSFISIFGGLGFLIAYLIENKKKNK